MQEAQRKADVLVASVRGAAHRRSGQPNQDAAQAEVADQGLPAILVVADGHGSAKCFRSHVGARMAVEVAVESLRTFAASLASAELPEYQPDLQSLTSEIVSRWRALVVEHLAVNPIEEAEIAALEPVIAAVVRDALENKNPHLIYGATLVSVLVHDGYLLCAQLGDGEILLVPAEHRTVQQPLPPDAELIANETTSLCQDGAEHKFRTCFHRIVGPPALILLTTDGYPNSFASPEGFRQVATDLLDVLEQDGALAVSESLPGWLDEASQQGSGDDVSVAILYCRKERP